MTVASAGLRQEYVSLITDDSNKHEPSQQSLGHVLWQVYDRLMSSSWQIMQINLTYPNTAFDMFMTKIKLNIC